MGLPVHSLLCGLWACVMLEESGALGEAAVDAGLHMGRKKVVGGFLLGKGRVKEARVVIAHSQQLGLGEILRAAPCYSSLGWLGPTSVQVSVTGSSCPKEGRGSPSRSEGVGLWCGWNWKPTHPLPSLLATSMQWSHWEQLLWMRACPLHPSAHPIAPSCTSQDPQGSAPARATQPYRILPSSSRTLRPWLSLPG